MNRNGPFQARVGSTWDRSCVNIALLNSNSSKISTINLLSASKFHNFSEKCLIASLSIVNRHSIFYFTGSSLTGILVAT